MKKLYNSNINIIKGIITFFLFFSSSNIQLLLIRILGFNIKKLSTTQATILSCTASIIITILLIILYRKELVKEFKIFKKNLSDNLDVGFKYWFIGLAIMAVSNLIIALVFKAGQANNEQSIQKMIEAVPYLVLISAGLFAPIAEEIFFRKAFKDNIKNPIIYVLVSSLIFGYLHVSSATTLSQFLYIIPYSSLGICFAICYVKTDTIFTSMSMHMLHNTILTIISILI